MARYILDTNHLSDALETVSEVRRKLQQMHRQGHRFGTCVPAIGELEAGIQQRRRLIHYRRNLLDLLQVVRLWPLELADGRVYGEIYLELRKRGRALSQVDIMLAALARRMDLVILTTDRDFEALPELRCENWLS